MKETKSSSSEPVKISLYLNKNRSKFEILLDYGSKIFAIGGGIAMIFITFHFSDITSDISKKDLVASKEQRKFSIRPKLEILPSINYTKDFDEIIVQVSNHGTGLALNLRAMIAYDGEIRGLVHHQFTSVVPKETSESNVIQNSDGTQQRMITLGKKNGKDWIEPREVVQFRFSPWQNIEKPSNINTISPSREFIIYLSFFDIDNNEYLTITKTPIGGKSAVIILAVGASTLTDSLISLSSHLKLFNSKTFDNLNFRYINGEFLDFDSSSSKKY